MFAYSWEIQECKNVQLELEEMLSEQLILSYVSFVA